MLFFELLPLFVTIVALVIVAVLFATNLAAGADDERGEGN